MVPQQDSSTPRKTIISAVGRSGTTIVHNLLLEIYSDLYGDNYDQLYEPFLWDSAALRDYPRIAERELRFGDMDSVSAEGVYCHTALPLFVDDVDAVESPSNVEKYLLADSTKPLVAKFIRANGRLPLLDTLYKDARYIILIRNPLDVVNSVLTRFSFFGEENHKSDFPRFRDDVERVFGVALPSDARQLPPAYKAALWCHFMNLFAVRHVRGKSNYLTIVYEAFRENRESTAKDICKHLGIEYKDSYGRSMESPVGRTTGGQPNLTKPDIDSIMPLFNEYWAMAEDLSAVSDEARERTLSRYDEKNLPHLSRPARGFGWSPIKAEGQIIALSDELTTQSRISHERIASVQRIASVNATPAGSDWRVPISVIVTSYNNASTLGATVQSVCQQTYLPQEIIIADDCSTDNSRQLIEDLAASNNLIKPVLRDTNVGVSANRNDAIRRCKSPFISQLDGDDAYRTNKLEREAYALVGCEQSVAFSDTEFMGAQPTYWNCDWLAGLTGNAAIAGMVSRRNPLPRDMLMAKDLFLRAEGYREDCSIYEDWAFKIRLAQLAQDWRYSGIPGTLYRPGGLSQSGAEKLMNAALWVLSTDVIDVLRDTDTLDAAFEGVLNLLRTDYDAEMLSEPDIRDQITMKMDAFLTELNSDYDNSSDDKSEINAINKAHKLVKMVQLSISAISTQP